MIHDSSYGLYEPVPYMMRCEKVREDTVLFRPTWQLCIMHYKRQPLGRRNCLENTII